MLRLHTVLKSSRAAIDLASIMVGIIIIGLIGGVIAATVFAVIPWSQDRAAKQQLDSIASAESAYRGLSTSKDANLQNAVSFPTSQSDPNQVVLNSTFTGSAGLEKNNLLTLNSSGSYCVIATTDGKDYHAYSKSGSGKWFYITSGKTQPSEYTGTFPCLTTGNAVGTVDPSVDNGSGVIPTNETTPSQPALPTTVYDFDTAMTTPSWDRSTGSTTVSSLAHSGNSLGYIAAGNTSGDVTSLSTTGFKFVTGKKYTMSVWVYQVTNYNVTMRTGDKGISNKTTAATAVNQWVKVESTFVAQGDYITLIFNATNLNSRFYIDDISITQLN